MPTQPAGTVTLLFTDIEGSTRLLQQLGDRYASVLAECRQLMRDSFAEWHGYEVDTQGDAFFVTFARATDAAAAAVDITQALATHAWPEVVGVRVRIGLHTGEPQLTNDGYVGLDVHHAARIMSAGHGGQILLSATTRPLVEQHLPEGTYLQDLGEHRLKDLHRPAHLFQLSISDLPTDFPPLRTLDTSPNNLPIQPTVFIGREKEVAQVCTLLRRPDVHMVTLTGPGGVGKTRLGLQVAAELCDLFPDGVFIVALAPVSDPIQVVPTIAQTLGIGEASDQPLRPLLEAALKGKQLLLLLDNFEQVVDAAVLVADLLTVCPRLKILVTSRVGLHVRAEHEVVVPPLAVPATKRLPGLQALSQYEAVALFIARGAQAVKPDFQVTNANAPAVAGICARLDGLPLALELAAARVKYFPPQTLFTRLEQDLSILSGGARDLPVRQRTLRATIAWSYELLSPGEQALFRRFAVFLDGCSWEAAEQVCNAAQELPVDLLEGLASLVDKSLLRQEERTEGEARFWMLQTLREFGLERLSEAGEMETTREAHAQYYLTLTEKADRHLRGKEQSLWLTRLEQEHENLRAALSWFIEWNRVEGETGRQHVEEALRLCIAMHSFWLLRGYIREGRTYLERALAKRAEASQRMQAAALTAAAELAFFLDDYERSEALAGESLSFYRELADPAGMAKCLFMLASICWTRSEYSQARSRYEEAAALFREAGDEWLRARCLTQLARISSFLGEYEAARLLLEQALEYYRIQNDTERMGWTLYLLAQVLFLSHTDIERTYSMAEQSLTYQREVYHQGMGYVLSLSGLISLLKGEHVQARALAEEGVTLLRDIGDRAGTAKSLIDLAWILAAQGDNIAATRLYFESFSILQEIQYKEFVPSCLEGLAAVKADMGEATWAVRLLGKAEEWRKRIGTPLPPVYRTRYEQTTAAARSDLSAEAFAAAWTEGQAMKLEEVLLPPNS